MKITGVNSKNLHFIAIIVDEILRYLSYYF